jgi:8-oxo-dGTP diphosphatase
MAHLKTKIAEYGIILNPEDKFLMLRFAKDVNPGERWIFPGGRLDEGEAPGIGLSREIKEETGLNSKTIIPCGTSMWGIDDDRRYAAFYLCKLDVLEDPVLSHEHQDFSWFSFEELDTIDFHDKSFLKVLKTAQKLLPFEKIISGTE